MIFSFFFRQLHAAIIQEFPEVALALIRLAPHPRFLDTPNDDAQSPLHLAIATGQAKIARTLIVAGARPSPRNLHGDSPLHIAARTGNVSCCKAIADPVHQQERDALALSYVPQTYQPPNLDQWNYDGKNNFFWNANFFKMCGCIWQPTKNGLTTSRFFSLSKICIGSLF